MLALSQMLIYTRQLTASVPRQAECLDVTVVILKGLNAV